MTHRISSGLLGLLVLLAGSLQVVSAEPKQVFGSISGFWLGPGRIVFEGGSSEALSCKAYYATSEQDRRLNIVLRCASPSNKIELRAKLAAEGSNLSGTWEERTFNAAGTAVGQATGREITLSIDGGGFTATMLVVQEGGQQRVSITTQGVGFTKVEVSLTRGANGGEEKPDAGRGLGTKVRFARRTSLVCEGCDDAAANGTPSFTIRR
jgi:hypothetical protein